MKEKTVATDAGERREEGADSSFILHPSSFLFRLYRQMRLIRQCEEQLAQAHQVVHAVLVVLHMPIEHRGIRSQPNPMRRPRRVQPLAPIDLVVADNMPHPVSKNLCDIHVLPQLAFCCYLRMQLPELCDGVYVR